MTQQYTTHSEEVAQHMRLECLRLATETGMNVDEIQPTADQWATFVLDGTTSKEN
ncbi:hypothetical protein [Gordonia sp. (in: high G+C Gram-positive bacteria)]|uniref:hypothetical protein n=1 Tax=Gordonia sp. (in: high G+C Gram-positive bacteria) TaxID=84139 RepID=UPI00261F2EB3|nr:hypothetical protein [Gordonia sp. (in: high G+C Gram-positive bacteria)]